MEMVVISKKQFDLLFENCLNKLKLETLQDTEYADSHLKLFVNLHRKFHYEISILKGQLENANI